MNIHLPLPNCVCVHLPQCRVCCLACLTVSLTTLQPQQMLSAVELDEPELLTAAQAWAYTVELAVGL